MTEPIEITVLRLFREFGSPPAVANFLKMRYSKVMYIISKEYENHKLVKELEAMDVERWPNRFTQSQTRKAKWSRAQTEKRRLGLFQPEEKKDRAISFGYLGNDFLKEDFVEKDTHKYKDEVGLRRSGNKYRTNRDSNPSLWNM